MPSTSDCRFGYYRDSKHNIVALCQKNTTDEPQQLFSAFWGPHGSVQPGNWACADCEDFHIEVADEDFVERFSWIDPQPVFKNHKERQDADIHA